MRLSARPDCASACAGGVYIASSPIAATPIFSWRNRLSFSDVMSNPRSAREADDKIASPVVQRLADRLRMRRPDIGERPGELTRHEDRELVLEAFALSV